jgi:hypothetical protein
VVAHPCTNGQVEHANGLILHGLKPRILTQEGEDVQAWLSTRVEKWATDVPSVLRSLQTTPNRSTNCTHFFMEYDSEAMLPIELQYRSPRMLSTCSRNRRTSSLQGRTSTNKRLNDTMPEGAHPGLPCRRLCLAPSADKER